MTKNYRACDKCGELPAPTFSNGASGNNSGAQEVRGDWKVSQSGSREKVASFTPCYQFSPQPALTFEMLREYIERGTKRKEEIRINRMQADALLLMHLLCDDGISDRRRCRRLRRRGIPVRYVPHRTRLSVLHALPPFVGLDTLLDSAYPKK